MLNRRLIRIKVFQALFAEFSDDTAKAEPLFKKVKASIMGIEQHFMTVLSFVPEFQDFITNEHNPSELKMNLTSDDQNTFDIISKNAFINALKSNSIYKSYAERPVLRWADEKDLMFLIYKQIREHEKFEELKVQEDSSERQFDFAVFLYKFLIKESVEFEQFMEEKNIVWYDEKIPILKNLERVFEYYTKEEAIKLPELSRDIEEDVMFAEELVFKYIEHKEELVSVINVNTPGWDSDRIMKIDFVLMCMALCEFKYLPFVPVKVSINEYIEVAKMYSTPQSSKFVNGTLDKILKEWQNEGLINKSGRGLIG